MRWGGRQWQEWDSSLPSLQEASAGEDTDFGRHGTRKLPLQRQTLVPSPSRRGLDWQAGTQALVFIPSASSPDPGKSLTVSNPVQ